ncbi:MAG TPA: hypothetical protein VF600_11725 [Abditibacteriaceae bacterium]|jgi:hypothetical protein
MSTQNNNGSRPRWSLGAGAWFATALLLLSLSSGGAAFGGGAAFAASTALATSSTPNCHAVLWLLHEMQTAAPGAVQPLASRAVSQAEFVSLLQELKDEPLANTNRIVCYSDKSKVAAAAQSQDSPLATVALDALRGLTAVYRSDVQPIRIEYSLEAHEAAFLSGTRTNSYLE